MVSNGRFRVTASTGSWRSLPWPFGLLNVTANGLRMHSWHWSWWVKDLEVKLEDVESIQIAKRFGTTRIHVAMKDGSTLKCEFAFASGKAIEDLRRFGYPLDVDKVT